LGLPENQRQFNSYRSLWGIWDQNQIFIHTSNLSGRTGCPESPTPEPTNKKNIEIQNSIPNIKTKPTVLAGAIYQDAWYLPGGNSYLAQLFKDANTNYLWKDDTQTGSLALSIETVLEKGQQADYWFAPGQHTSYSILEEEHVLYSKFEAIQTKSIFTYARSKGSTGGLLFFESGATRPDLVLKDIIHHLYPELHTAYSPTYFLPLDD
jgi:iron complex transport system substrate-binding protein